MQEGHSGVLFEFTSVNSYVPNNVKSKWTLLSFITDVTDLTVNDLSV